ncbi:lysozyme, partial [Helicobacter valdiviensis]
MVGRNFLYSIHKDKKSIYLLCENKSIIDCQSIYEELYKLEATTDFTFEELQNYQAYIFLNSTLLTGSTELPNNSFYFGEPNKEGNILQDKPSYYFSPSDESSGKGRLAIFYKNDELC